MMLQREVINFYKVGFGVIEKVQVVWQDDIFKVVRKDYKNDFQSVFR